MTATPVLKWAGGKGRLLPALHKHLPPTWGKYYEPFVGGGAMFFSLTPKRASLSDANADLVTTYRVVRDDVDALIAQLKIHKARHCAVHYLDTRAAWNRERQTWPDVVRAATFIYLNKTCYNGLWRVNKAGHFNVPIGRYIDPPICDEEGLQAASAALAETAITCCDFRTAIANAVAGDLIYFDPPYVPVSASANFVSYTEGRFGEADQRELADVARGLVRRGCHVIVSQSDTPLAREIWGWHGFTLESVPCGRAINSKGDKRGAVAELIITNGPGVS